MSKLLEQAFAQLRDLPEDFQDKAARQLIRYVDEISTDDRTDVADGRDAYRRGETQTLAQWRNDVGIIDN
ncbi:MAG: hypothetical protein KF750_00575 [Xanthobacteraceae bacterium]|nr:hypothetical protein [Xanthobacteraceae bacterium]